MLRLALLLLLQADGTIPGLKEGDVASKDGNSVTMWDRQPSMTEKKKLMMAAMGGLKMRPNVAASMHSKGGGGGSVKPTGLRQPSIKKKAPAAAPRAEKPAAAAAAAASSSSFDAVELPERQKPPAAAPGFVDEYHQTSKWDFYIGYRQGVDDDAAAALADAIERDCVKEHGGTDGVTPYPYLYPYYYPHTPTPTSTPFFVPITPAPAVFNSIDNPWWGAAFLRRSS